MINWFIAGGWTMWPLLACWLVMCFVLVERMFFLWEWRKKQDPAKLEKMRGFMWDFLWKEAHALGRESGDLTVEALTHALEHPQKDKIEKPFQMVLQKGLKDWRRFIMTLETLVGTAPMLGILGTVTGIIKTFKSLSWDDPSAQANAMAGLSEALITTEFGLVIAIPAGVLAAILVRQSERWAEDLEHLGSELEHAITQFEKKSGVSK